MIGKFVHMNLLRKSTSKASMTLRSMSSPRCQYRFPKSISGCAPSTRRCRISLPKAELKKPKRCVPVLYQRATATGEAAAGQSGCGSPQIENASLCTGRIASFQASSHSVKGLSTGNRRKSETPRGKRTKSGPKFGQLQG